MVAVVSDLENLPPFEPIAVLKILTSIASNFFSEGTSTKIMEKGPQRSWFHLSCFY